MISFVSLFLGLVMGVQTVEVALSVPAEQVELTLDGQVAATLDAPPWTSARGPSRTGSKPWLGTPPAGRSAAPGSGSTCRARRPRWRWRSSPARTAARQ